MIFLWLTVRAKQSRSLIPEQDIDPPFQMAIDLRNLLSRELTWSIYIVFKHPLLPLQQQFEAGERYRVLILRKK